jgi:hypothetical protein
MAKKLLKEALSSGEITGLESTASMATVLKGIVGEVGQLRFMVDLVQVMPDAIKIGNSKVYKDWVAKQPPAIKALHNSLNVEDALTLINYFKEDTARGKAAEHDGETGVRADKINKTIKQKKKKSRRPKTETESEKKKKQSFKDAFNEALGAS